MTSTQPASEDRAAAFYDLGLSHWTGTGGKPLDLIEAHKWFNLAAGSGNPYGRAPRRS